MPLFRTRSDLPLARDPATRFLGWITALMVYLGALALAGALVVSDMAQRWDGGLAGGLTVQVMPPGAGEEPALAERVERALALVRAAPGVTRAEALSAEATARLVEPWLGRAAAEDPLLPMPAVIDVATDGTADAPALARRLAEAVPGTILDDHGAWLASLRTFARAVEAAALAVLAMIAGAGVLTVVFAVRAGLAIHQPVVELLHLMGATDRYVARQFERHVLGLTLAGGLGGLALAAATLMGILAASEGLRATLLPDFALQPWQWAALAAVPAAAALLAVLTARWTVLRTLGSMP